MTELNPLLEAMNDIDDNIIAKSMPKKKRFSLPVAIAAAAALLLTGYSTVFRNEARFDNGVVIDYNITNQNLTVPTEEELLEMGAIPDADSAILTMYTINALPSEVFEKFGTDILINENFVERPCDVEILFFHSIDDPRGVTFNYNLMDRNIGAEIRFRVQCENTDQGGFSSTYEGMRKAEYDVLTLNDGSEALIWKWDELSPSATFSYNGNVYELKFWVNGPVRDFTLDDMKQVLTDLGVM